MRKLVTIIVSVALLGISALTAPVSGSSGVSLGVSPSSVSISVAPGSPATVDFCVFYFTGDVTVTPVGLPVTVSPLSFPVASPSTPVTLTVYGASSATGTYSGYLRFTGQSDDVVSVAVEVGVNVQVVADVSASPPSTTPPTGGGGGGGGGVWYAPTPTPTPTAPTQPTTVPATVPPVVVIPTSPAPPTATPSAVTPTVPVTTAPAPAPTTHPTSVYTPSPEDWTATGTTTTATGSGVWLWTVILFGVLVVVVGVSVLLWRIVRKRRDLFG